jgi:hypothetical protein
MRFDSSARAQHLLRKTWNADPRLLRFSVVKMGTKLEDIADVGGKAEEWGEVEGNEGKIATEVSPTQAREAAESNLLSDMLGGGGESAKSDSFVYK